MPIIPSIGQTIVTTDERVPGNISPTRQSRSRGGRLAAALSSSGNNNSYSQCPTESAAPPSTAAATVVAAGSMKKAKSPKKRRRRPPPAPQLRRSNSPVCRRRENRLTRISLAIVWLFLFSHIWKLIPTGYELLVGPLTKGPELLTYIQHLSHFLIVLNSSLNFPIYIYL